MEKKQFILDQIAPYLADPSICGFDDEKAKCAYLTSKGKMCVVGKNLLEPELFRPNEGALGILSIEQEELKPEVRGILTNQEWQLLQFIHDDIAVGIFSMEAKVNNLSYLTTGAIKSLNISIEEFKEAAKKLIN